MATYDTKIYWKIGRAMTHEGRQHILLRTVGASRFFAYKSPSVDEADGVITVGETQVGYRICEIPVKDCPQPDQRALALGAERCAELNEAVDDFLEQEGIADEPSQTHGADTTAASEPSGGGAKGATLTGMKIPVLPDNPTHEQIKDFAFDVGVLQLTGVEPGRIAAALFSNQTESTKKLLRGIPTDELSPERIIERAFGEKGSTPDEELTDRLGDTFNKQIEKSVGIREYLTKYDDNKRDIEKEIPEIPEKVWSNMLLYNLKPKVSPKDQRNVRSMAPGLKYSEIVAAVKFLFPQKNKAANEAAQSADAGGKNRKGKGKKQDALADPNREIRCRHCGEKVKYKDILKHNQLKHPRKAADAAKAAKEDDEDEEANVVHEQAETEQEFVCEPVGEPEDGGDEASLDLEFALCAGVVKTRHERNPRVASYPSFLWSALKMFLLTVFFYATAAACCTCIEPEALAQASELACMARDFATGTGSLEMLCDPGATSHFMNDKKWFKTFTKIDRHVEIADGKKLKITGEGDCVLRHRGTNYRVRCLYVPEMKAPLFSPRKVCREGGTYFECKEGCEVSRNGMRIFGFPSGKQMAIRFHNPDVEAHEEALTVSTLKQHIAMGHIGYHPDCKACKQANGRKKQHKRTKAHHHRAERPNGRLHIDTLGPLPPTGKGNRYAFVMVDERTRWCEVYLAPSKEAKHTLEALKFWVKKHRAPECLRSDNGGEYTARSVEDFLTGLNIRVERTSPYSPQQNSIVERLNGVLMRSVRACLCGLNKSLWGYAMKCAAYARNRMPREALDGESPYETWRGRKPSTKHMIPFYQRVLFRRYKYRNKTEEQREPGRFLYYSDFSGDYVVEDQNGSVIQSRNCRVVDEGEAPTHGTEDDASDDEEWLGDELHPDFPEDEAAHVVTFADQYSDPDHELAHLVEAITYGKAMKAGDRGDWAKAIDGEPQNFIDKDVFEEVDYDHNDPQMRKAMNMKMALTKKEDEQGKTTKHKARGVVLGNFQPVSDKLFSPVIRWATLRAIIVLAWSMGWKIFQCDISAAFLNAKITTPRYVFPPSCWRKPGKVWRLKRAVYGMRESGALWCEDISAYLLSLGFERSKADAGLYVREDALILLYVDDIILLAKTEETRAEIQRKIFEKYEGKEIQPETVDGEPVYKFLGVKFLWGKDRLKFFQRDLVEKILEHFGFEHCRPAPTPMTEHDKTAEDTGKHKGYTVDASNYRSFVGSIMYLQVATRWDLSYTTAYLSRFLENPGERQFRMAKRLLRYLSGTKDFALECRRGGEGLAAFSDATWGGEDAGKSVSGAMIFLMGLPVIWHAKLQKSVSLSSCESEYIAGAETHKELSFLRNLLEEPMLREVLKGVLKYEGEKLATTPVFYDNIGAKYISEARENKRCKHILLRWHFVREMVEDKLTRIIYVPTTRQLADIMTKPLVEAKFSDLSKRIKNFSLRETLKEFAPAQM